MRRVTSQCGDKDRDHLAAFTDLDGLAFVNLRLDAGEFIPKFAADCCRRIVHSHLGRDARSEDRARVV